MLFPLNRQSPDQILNAVWPVGSVFISTVATDPAQLMGFGVWQAFGTGRVLVGIDAGQTEFDTLGETGGSKTVTLTAAQMPSHTHVQDPHTHTQNAHSHVQNLPSSQTGSQASGTRDTSTTGTVADALSTASATATNQNATATNQNTGGDGSHPNLPPYIVVKMWLRTA